MNWQRLLADSVTTADGLLSRLGLDIQHLPEIDSGPDFPIRVPQPFIDRMRRGDPFDPLLRQVLAVSDERHSTSLRRIPCKSLMGRSGFCTSTAHVFC